MTTETSLVSPRLTTLWQELEAGNTAVLDAFWQEVSQQGAPLIEPMADDEKHSPVHLGGSKSTVWSGDFSRLTLPKTTKVVTTIRRVIYAAMYQLFSRRPALGMDNSKPAEPLNIKISLRMGAQGVSAEKPREIVVWAEAHSRLANPSPASCPPHILWSSFNANNLKKPIGD